MRLATSSARARLPHCPRHAWRSANHNTPRAVRLCNRRTMAKKYLLLLWLGSFPFLGGGSGAAQDDPSSIRVNVVLVQLNVAITDGKGNYVSALRPEDFSVVEDNIPEKIATFEEGNEPTRKLIAVPPNGGAPQEPVPAKVQEAEDEGQASAGFASSGTNV